MKYFNEITVHSRSGLLGRARAGLGYIADKVLIINLDDTLSVSVEEQGCAREYLVGGEQTKALLAELRQAGVVICVANRRRTTYEDGRSGKKDSLVDLGVSEYCSFLLEDDDFASNALIVATCLQAFTPETKSGSKRGTPSTSFYVITSENTETKDGMSRIKAQVPRIGLSILQVTPQQSADSRVEDLHRALSEAKRHFGLPVTNQLAPVVRQNQPSASSGFPSTGVTGDVKVSGAAIGTAPSIGVPGDVKVSSAETSAAASGGVYGDAKAQTASFGAGSLSSADANTSTMRRKSSKADGASKFTKYSALSDPKPHSLTFGEWLWAFFVPKIIFSFIKRVFSKPEDNTQKPSLNLNKNVQNFFLSVYGFDGLDLSRAEVIYADEPVHSNNKIYTGSRISNWLILASFLGLPSRPLAMLDGKRGYYPELSWGQLAKDFVGGWDFKADTPKAKFILGALIIPKLIIFMLKVATWPLKLLISILKIFTEILPVFLWVVIATFCGLFSNLARETLNSSMHPGLKYPLFVLVSLVAIVFGIVEYATTILCKLGQALTSPEQYFRAVLGRARKLENKKLATFFSVVNGTFAVLLTCVMWSIAFPLLFGAVVAQIPALMSFVSSILQLPLMATSLTWVSNLSVISTLGSAISALGAYLSVAFGPVVLTLASVVGANISVGVMLLGTALGALTAPVAIAWTTATDWLSNQWASWHDDIKPSQKTENKGQKYHRLDESDEVLGGGQQLKVQNDEDGIPLVTRSVHALVEQQQGEEQGVTGAVQGATSKGQDEQFVWQPGGSRHAGNNTDCGSSITQEFGL